MICNDTLHHILNEVKAHRLGKSIAMMENYLYTCPQPQAMEMLEGIKGDYRLMAGYWQQGYDDPERAKVYDRLLRRMYVLVANADTRYRILNSTFTKGVYNRTRSNPQRDWTLTALQRDLEGFPLELALTDLEAENVRERRRRELYEQHLQLMTDLFDYIWTSRLWTDSVTDFFRRTLLSDVIDSNDRQLLVSAVMLSCLNTFGINKFRLLVDVYTTAADECVRQRALIAWVLCADSSAATLYGEMHDLVEKVAADARCRDELAELQMQLIYCLRAESDNRIIQGEIIPELLKNNNLRVTRNGIEEVEDDPTEDVLHPELSEQRMEKLEASMQRMADMQRQGSDIYFGGFSQMKRFPFFNATANWFMPYTAQHPVVSAILSKVRAGKFLSRILERSPFCDSDKYSFALGFEMAVNRLPDSMLQMLDRGEATLAGAEDVSAEQLAEPAFLRRSCLQGLYRFFRVFPQRSDFFNPFDDGDGTGVPRYLFLASPLFRQTAMEARFGEVAGFLMKHKAYDAAKLLLQNYREECRDAQFYLLNGRVLTLTRSRQNAGLTALESFKRLVALQPEGERGLAGYARALFGVQDYRQALHCYEQLLDRHPDNRNYQLNDAVCRLNMDDYEGALKRLYKLNYETPADDNVNRVLAWALTGVGKYEQALRIYDGLTSAGQSVADDLLNAAYCHWFSGDVAGAIALFRRHAKCGDNGFDALREFLVTESAMLTAHGIGETERRLMAEQLLS